MHESADEHLLEKILGNNDELARHNRQHFNELNLFAVNIMSAPGAGKTSLLEAALDALDAADSPQHPTENESSHFSLTGKSLCIVEGDMVGELDAARLRKKGVSVHQIGTGRACHLDAQMVARLLHTDHFGQGCDCLLIENVGNLVCPAEFQLGEHKRVVLLSVTEGDDKPLKYPVIFRKSDLVIFTKCDLLPFVEFDLQQAEERIRNINPNVEVCKVSARSADVGGFLSWLNESFAEYRRGKLPALESLHV